MWLPFLCRRERNVPRQGSPPPWWSLLTLAVPVWRSTGPSTAAPAWMAGAAHPSRPGLSRSGFAVMMGKPSPRASWWSSPAAAATTAHMPVKPIPTTDWSMTFINLGTNLLWGWDAKHFWSTQPWRKDFWWKWCLAHLRATSRCYRSALCNWTLMQQRFKHT